MERSKPERQKGAGKGPESRPLQISRDEWDDNYNRIRWPSKKPKWTGVHPKQHKKEKKKSSGGGGAGPGRPWPDDDDDGFLGLF